MVFEQNPPPRGEEELYVKINDWPIFLPFIPSQIIFGYNH
jgi:hypothetical protein